MIPIAKGRPPRELLEKVAELRSTPDASVGWDGVTDRGPIREALCREQGGLCAYCMKAITPASSHVEHIVPQSRCEPGQDVDYGNMLAVCDGNEGAGRRGALTCDRARQDAPLSVNPLKPATLKGIRYRKDGVICSTDEDVQRDLDRTLNLNCREAYLPENRKAVVEELDRWMLRSSRRGSVVGACRRKREAIDGPGSKPEYAGVLMYFLDRRIRRGE